jgi:hypothetical protein
VTAVEKLEQTLKKYQPELENVENNASAIILAIKLLDPVKDALNDCGITLDNSNTQKNPSNCLPDMLQAKQYYDRIQKGNRDIFAVGSGVVPLGQALMKASVDCGN